MPPTQIDHSFHVACPSGLRYANGGLSRSPPKNSGKTPVLNGMKTGYTEAAGYCLIASGARPGRDIIVVVLGDSKTGVWQDASALLSWGLWMNRSASN